MLLERFSPLKKQADGTPHSDPTKWVVKKALHPAVSGTLIVSIGKRPKIQKMGRKDHCHPPQSGWPELNKGSLIGQI